jgi:hypothetical protein
MFFKYFLKKKPAEEVVANPDSPTDMSADTNYCLFILDGGDSGIFFANLGPGIKDCKNGVLYVAPEKYVQENCMRVSSSYHIRLTILKYFGKITKGAKRAAWDY